MTSTGLAATLLVIAVLGRQSSLVHRVLTTRWSVALGRWSYGIYLWHLPIIFIIADNVVMPEGLRGLVAWLAIVLGLSIPLSAATYAWVERPLLARARGEKQGAGGRASPAAAGSRPDAQAVPAQADPSPEPREASERTREPSAITATQAHATQPSSTVSLSAPPGG